MSVIQSMAILDVDVLSPVFIKGDSGLYGVDIVEKDNSIYVIDLSCLTTYMARRGIRVLEANLNSLFSEALRAFQHGELRCRPFTIKAECRETTLPAETPVELPVAEYIPASSIKGLLRTALVYAYLDVLGDSIIESIKEVLQALKKGEIKLVDAGKKIEALVFKGFKPHGRGRFEFDALRLLNISDPLEFTANLELVKMERVKVVDGDIVAETFSIVFGPGSKFSYNMIIQSPPERLSFAPRSAKGWLDRLEEVDTRVNLQVIHKGLGKFSKYILDSERAKLKRSRIERIQKIEDSIAKRSREGCYPVKVGYGAGYYSKTILPWLAKKNPSLYDEVKKLLSRYYNRPWDDHTVSIASGLPVGWILLCIRGVEE